jgi:predicted ATP-grasp superfamily ATP-dependent carboligase
MDANRKIVRVLVLDANQRGSLAVIRSLGKISGVEIFCADHMKEALATYSRFCQKYFQSPSAKDDPQAFLNWMSSVIKRYNFNYLFPITEITSQLILQNRHCLGSASIPFANYETVMKLADKAQLMRNCSTIGIPIPKTFYFDNANQLDISSVAEFPVVIKPNLSHIWLGDRWMSTEVQIAHSRSDLEAFLYNSEWLQSHPFMIQEFIEGHGQGVFALYSHGKPIAFFAHKRLREKPPAGGVSVLCESVTLSDTLKNYAKSILDSVGWHGVAMVEFRIAKDGTPYLMEVNTRFWGSLQLAIDSGVDFPCLLYRLCKGERVEPVSHYKVGIRMRWLLGDIDSLYLLLKDPKYSIRQKIRGTIDFLTPRPFITYHQVNRWDDLAPAWSELKSYWKDIINR